MSVKSELSISEPSIKAAIDDAALAFKKMSDTAKLDAEILLLHVIEKPKAYLFTWPDAVLTTEQLEYFTSLVEQRLLGHPIAHLIGKRDFWTLTLEVNNSTLIPRPDTELLVETVLIVVLSSNRTAPRRIRTESILLSSNQVMVVSPRLSRTTQPTK